MKKYLIKLFFVILTFILIIGCIPITSNAEVYKGTEGDTKWDAFAGYVYDMMTTDKPEKLTKKEIERYFAGPTDDERKEGANIPLYNDEKEGIKDALSQLLENLNQNGQSTDNNKWEELRKKAYDKYNEAVGKAVGSKERKKAYQEFLDLVKEMEKVNRSKTRSYKDSGGTLMDKVKEAEKETSNEGEISDEIYENQVNDEGEVKKEKKVERIYKMGQEDTKGVEDKNIGDIITDGGKFENKTGNSDLANIKIEDVQKLSGFLYNTLLVIGVAVAVIIGGLIGIKLMTGSAEQKAEAKQYLMPYIIGCIIVFGAFGIWQLVVNVLQATKG